MSSLDTYRRDIERKTSEIARLQSEKANQVRKRADIQRRIASANQSASRATSPSSVRMHQNSATSLQRDLASADKKIADVESKIASEQKRLGAAQTKLAQEEVRTSKKRQSELDRATKRASRKMEEVAGTLGRHEALHLSTKVKLEELASLPEKVTVLFLASNPIDQPLLRLDEEARAIGETITKSKHRDSVELRSAWAIRPPDVLQALNEHRPAIVHFSGHGSENDEIVFQDQAGKAKCVSLEAIVQTMMASSDAIRLVFFNTCHSRNQAASVVRHVEAAIGMNTEIGDEAARIFASQFYSAIGFGLSVQKAFDQARALLMMEEIREENTPELFVADGLAADELFIVRPAKISFT